MSTKVGSRGLSKVGHCVEVVKMTTRRADWPKLVLHVIILYMNVIWKGMWPDILMLEKDARSDWKDENAYWTKLNQSKLQRSDVKKVLVTPNTFPARGDLF